MSKSLGCRAGVWLVYKEESAGLGRGVRRVRLLALGSISWALVSPKMSPLRDLLFWSRRVIIRLVLAKSGGISISSGLAPSQARDDIAQTPP